MQALGPTEVQDLLNVTAQSIARHCGLANDPSNPDTRSEERRITDLRRQVRLLALEELPTVLNTFVDTSLVSYTRCLDPKQNLQSFDQTNISAVPTLFAFKARLQHPTWSCCKPLGLPTKWTITLTRKSSARFASSFRHFSFSRARLKSQKTSRRSSSRNLTHGGVATKANSQQRPLTVATNL